MTGKDKCKRLKSYRNALAKGNGIDFKAKDCDFEGECPGYCPACDEEIRFLEKELRKKESQGEPIKFQGLIQLAFKNGDTVYDYTPSNTRSMLGRIVDRYPKAKNKEENEISFQEAIAKMIKAESCDTNNDEDSRLLGVKVSPDNEVINIDNDDSTKDTEPDILMGDIVPDYIGELLDDDNDDIN